MIQVDLKKVIPVGDRVIVKPHETSNEIEGFIIPENAKEKPCTGVVIASGPGTSIQPNVTKAGDVVLFGKYGGADIELNGEKLIIIRDSDIGLILIRNDEKGQKTPEANG